MSLAAILQHNMERAGRVKRKPPLKLSQRHLEVLKLACADYKNQAIADELKISKKTVEKHRQALAQLSNTHSPIGLYKWALAHGYTEFPAKVDK